jgi:hypothetical protein
MNREEYLTKIFPLKDGTTYIQNLDKYMSEKKIDKAKAAKKLHGLQKRMTRMEENEGHSVEKEGKRKGMLKRFKEKLFGTFKPKSVRTMERIIEEDKHRAEELEEIKRISQSFGLTDNNDE